MAILDPTTTRLSPHFLLSDVMGCSSIYTQGLSNVFDKARGEDIRLANLQALAESALEPILATVGSFSITYGFISPEVSRELVTYQDWRKPSHHRADLGAAVDIIPHHYVLQSTSNEATNTTGAPIRFALEHMVDLPLSRLITYSESPCICVAVSAEELRRGEPRGAWYENRYNGVKGGKPRYLKYPSPAARARAYTELCECGHPHNWQGGGYPSYHGGGRRQLHHRRVSRNTMVTDFLFDQQFMQLGVKNIPSMEKAAVAEAFELAGAAYDHILRMTGVPRVSIVSGYTSHLAPGYIVGRDWREGDVVFEIVPPSYMDADTFCQEAFKQDTQEGRQMLFGQLRLEPDADRVIVTVRRDFKYERREETTAVPPASAVPERTSPGLQRIRPRRSRRPGA